MLLWWLCQWISLLYKGWVPLSRLTWRFRSTLQCFSYSKCILQLWWNETLVLHHTCVILQVLEAMLAEISASLLEGDVNVKLVGTLRRNIRTAVNFEEMPGGVNKRRIIQQAVFKELCKVRLMVEQASQRSWVIINYVPGALVADLIVSVNMSCLLHLIILVLILCLIADWSGREGVAPSQRQTQCYYVCWTTRKWKDNDMHKGMQWQPFYSSPLGVSCWHPLTCGCVLLASSVLWVCLVVNWQSYFTCVACLLVPEERLEDLPDLCRHIQSRGLWPTEAKCNQSSNPFLWKVNEVWLEC